MKRSKAAVLMVVAVACGVTALDAGEVVGWRGETSEALGVAANPLGLQNTLERAWRRRLFASASPLLADAHVSFGIADRLTPAYNRVGVWAELAPLSILELRAGIEPVAYFGTFKSLLSFERYDARFDDDARAARSGEAGFAVGGRAYLAPTLKLRAGPVVARARAEFEWWKARIDGAYFYEPARDTLLKASGDAMLTSESMVLVELASGRRKLLVGLVHDFTLVYAASQNRKQDLGVLGVVGLGGHAVGLREPTLVAKLVRYIEDPYRKNGMGVQLGIRGELGRAR
jgi:hypothetical protein